MDDQKTVYEKLPIEKISREAREAYDKLEPRIKEMYRCYTCNMCPNKITTKQLNKLLIEGVPPVCPNCYEKMKEQIRLLAPLFQQLGLF